MRRLVQWRTQGAQHAEDRDNFAVSCAECKPHRWHGLACNVSLCLCPTSWTEPA